MTDLRMSTITADATWKQINLLQDQLKKELKVIKTNLMDKLKEGVSQGALIYDKESGLFKTENCSFKIDQHGFYNSEKGPVRPDYFIAVGPSSYTRKSSGGWIPLDTWIKMSDKERSYIKTMWTGLDLKKAEGEAVVIRHIIHS